MKRKKVQNVYLLSSMQEGILFHSLINKDSYNYFEHVNFTIRGDLDLSLFEKSFNLLIERHEALRTVFAYKNVKRPMQVVIQDFKSKVYFEDISIMNKNKQAQYAEEFIRKDRERGFDLLRDILIRISVLKLEEQCFSVLWSFHHIILDGWSMGILIDEFFKIYVSLRKNSSVQLDGPVPFGRYMKWLGKQNQKVGIEYWNNYLCDYNSLSMVPGYKKTSENDAYIQQEIEFRLDNSIMEKINQLSKLCKVTISTIIKTVWGVMLQRYNNTDDVVFGGVVSGRTPEINGMEKMVGLFINTIPIRIKTNGNELFVELLQKVQEAAIESEKFSYVPLVDIQSNTHSRHELISHIISFENYPIEDEMNLLSGNESLGFKVSNVKTFEQTNYDFNIIVTSGRGLIIKLVYNALAINKGYVEQIAQHFITAIEMIGNDSNILVKNIDILTDVEKKELLTDFNNTAIEYSENKTICSVFEEVQKKNPKRIAVACNDIELTYEDLDKKANHLAAYLRKKGLKKDCVVAVILDRSIEMVITIMGILKAGGAYLPIDPKMPKSRIQTIFTDSKISLILSKRSIFKTFNFTLENHSEFVDTVLDSNNVGQEVVYVEEYFDSEMNLVTEKLSDVNKPSDLAYVIYTSGSTGRPKGVMIEHRNVLNLVEGLSSSIYSRYEPHLNVALVASFSFDASVQQIFAALLLGHTLHIILDDVKTDGRRLIDYYIKHDISVSDGTPAHLSIMGNAGVLSDKRFTVKHFIIGGEPLTYGIVSDFLKCFGNKKPQITNIYGPTECCVDSTSYLLPANIKAENDIVSIGTPLANVKVYILSETNQMVSKGVPGEICIAGAGVGRGYMNDSKLTNEKFIKSEFLSGERLYKTGDIGRWSQDGKIEFIKRKDNQVKIRGYRIELEEIECALLKHKDIKEAIVVVNDESYEGATRCNMKSIA